MRDNILRTLALVALALGAFSAPIDAQGAGRQNPGTGVTGPVPSSEEVPGELSDVGFDQRLGEPIPTDLTFRDEQGEAVRLGEYFGERPVLLSLVYYECPMLCPMTLQGLSGSLKALTYDAGEGFEVVVVSFDPGEGPEQAAAAKAATVTRYGRSGTEDGWHFLTGDEEAIATLTEAVGFRYTYDAEADEYAHAAGLVMATPNARVARYFFGIEYPAKDLKLGLVEAGEGQIGSLVDQLLLYCFHYDPGTGRYAWSERAILALRFGGLATILGLGGFIFVMVRQERSKNRSDTRGA